MSHYNALTVQHLSAADRAACRGLALLQAAVAAMPHEPQNRDALLLLECLGSELAAVRVAIGDADIAHLNGQTVQAGYAPPQGTGVQP